MHLSKQEVDALLYLDRFTLSVWETEHNKAVGRPERIRRAIMLAYKLAKDPPRSGTGDSDLSLIQTYSDGIL